VIVVDGSGRALRVNCCWCWVVPPLYDTSQPLVSVIPIVSTFIVALFFMCASPQPTVGLVGLVFFSAHCAFDTAFPRILTLLVLHTLFLVFVVYLMHFAFILFVVVVPTARFAAF